MRVCLYLPECERELSVDTIPLNGLGVDEDDAPQHRRIVAGQLYLPGGQIQGEHTVRRGLLVHSLGAELIPVHGSATSQRMSE